MRFAFTAIYFILILGADKALAAIKLTDVQGASTFNITSGVTPTIYGGTGGDSALGATCTSTDGLTPCDSCATATTLAVCNRRRIDSNLHLRILFKSDSADGKPILLKDTTVIKLEGSSVSKGNTATLDVVWGTVCNNLATSDNNCISSGLSSNSATFKVGIDVNGNGAIDTGDDSTQITVTVINPDPTNAGTYDIIDNCAVNTLSGICDFLAYPGDEKVFIDGTEQGTGFPTTPGSQITSVNVYYSETAFITKPADATPRVLSISQTGTDYEIVDNVVGSLPNNVPLFFRISVSDQAGNEMMFTSDTAITNQCTSLTPTPPFDGTGGGTLCPYAAVPDEVVGLLDKNVNCFIATAAFGSPFHPLVDGLREFRNKILLPFSWGRKFVDWYYHWSPPKAFWLKSHPVFRHLVGLLLVPIWAATRLIIWWPITMILAMLIWASFWREKKRITRE